MAGFANPSFALRYGTDTAARKYFGKSYNSVYQARKRLIQRGSLEECEGGQLQMTERGYADVLKIKLVKADVFTDNESLMILFDIPELNRKKRDRLRNLLKMSGCVQLQRSVWITPFNIVEPLLEIIGLMRLEYCVRLYFTKRVIRSRS